MCATFFVVVTIWNPIMKMEGMMAERFLAEGVVYRPAVGKVPGRH